MTIFDVRALALIIAPAMAAMPSEKDAAELERGILAFIQTKRPDTTADDWHELLLGTGHFPSS